MDTLGNDFSILDLIDVELLQELQDSFSNIMGVASIALNETGPITKPSGFTDFCVKYTRGTKEGSKKCNECDLKWGKISAETRKPVIYDCHAGLIDFAVPIIVGERHVASLFGGQVFTSPPDEQHFRNLARELGINEDEYIQALRKIKIVPREIVELGANFLFLIANTTSKLANKNLELLKKNQKEVLLRKIIEKIRSSLDVEETLDFIVEEITKTFKVQKTVITYFPELGNYSNFIVKKEFKTSKEYKSIPNDEKSSRVAAFWGEKLMASNEVFTVNDIENCDAPEYFKEFYNSLGVKSIVGLPIKKGRDVWGMATLSEYNKTRTWTEDDRAVLKSISDQIYIAINQAELFEQAQKTAKNERFVRELIELIRSSLNLEEVKTKIVEAIGKEYKADRCYFRSFDKQLNKFIPPDIEYRSNEKIKSLLNVEPDQEELQFFANEVRKQNKGFYPIVVNRETTKGTPLEKYLIESNISADYAIPIISRSKDLLWLVLHFEKEDPNLTEEDEKLLEIVAYQLDIAFEQINLYNNLKKTASRETLLRALTEKIRSSLDLDETLSYICENIANIFNVQRVVIAISHDKEDQRMFVPKKEYKISDNIQSVPNIEKFRKVATDWSVRIAETKDIVTIDNINNADFSNDFKEIYKEIGVKSAVGIPIKQNEIALGILVLFEYNKYRTWSEEEKELLKTISNQTYIAINQAQLYEAQKIAAERERISRNIIEIMRSTLDEETIKKLFVKNIGKFFNADRVFICNYDEKCKCFLSFDENSEYLSSSDLKSFANVNWEDPSYGAYLSKLTDKRELLILSIKDFITNAPGITQELIDILEEGQVKSAYSFPIVYQDKLKGAATIAFCNKETKLGEEDINRIRSICTQAGIAIHHSDLYLRTQRALQEKDHIINLVKEGVDPPVNEIIESSKKIFEKISDPDEKFHLDIIVESCNKILDLTKTLFTK